MKGIKEVRRCGVRAVDKKRNSPFSFNVELRYAREINSFITLTAEKN
jgi:hypothetical protein